MAAGSKRGDMVLGGRHLIGIFFLLVVVLGLVFTLGYLLGRSQYDTQLRAAAGDLIPSTHAANPPPRASVVTSASKDKDAPEIPAGSPRAAKNKVKDAAAPDAPEAPPDPAVSEWDFYHAADPPKGPERLEKPEKPEKIEKSTPRSARQTAADPSVSVPARTAGEVNTPPPPSKNPPRAVSISSGKPINPPLIPRGATVLQVAALAHEADALMMAQALQKKKFPAFVLSPDGDKFYRVQVGPYSDPRAATAARQRLENQGFKSIIKR